MRNRWSQYKIDHVVEWMVSDYLIVAMYSHTSGYVEPIAYGIFRLRKGGTEREFLSNLRITASTPREVVLDKVIKQVLSMIKERKAGGDL